VPTFCRAFARKGFALMGMRMPRLAKVAFEEGLTMDPTHSELKRGMEEATQAVRTCHRSLFQLALEPFVPDLPYVIPRRRGIYSLAGTGVELRRKPS